MDIANTQMPFGKYKGRMLVDLPEEYLFREVCQEKAPSLRKARATNGNYLAIKIDGLEGLLKPLKQSR
ncbi:putative quorum-sensing-regulated virulence factor [Enterobacter hormaechei]